MSTWESIFLMLGAVGLLWLTYTQVKRLPPELFSKVAIHKTIYVIGILTLGFIIFVWILVKLLNM